MQKAKLQCRLLQEVIVTKGKIYIVGAGGFSREIYDYLSTTKFEYKGYQCAGFLDDDTTQLDNFDLEHSIIGPLEDVNIPKGSKLIIGLANPLLKERLFKFYSELDISFITYIHPSATVGKYIQLGEGCVICPNVTITTNVKIGLCSTVNAHSSIGHDVIIGDFCTLSGHCDITGQVHIGNRVMLGSHALIIPRKIVESDSIIGAGSVVIKRVRSGTTVFGNPAKIIN
jgi:sugar O-acyltransferase (sialic acid O-acetyltransferase NeuD family)